MSYRLVFSAAAREDIERLYRFLAEQSIPAAEAALQAMNGAWALLTSHPFTGRKADMEDALLRELVISFGNSGYVALYDITDHRTVTVLAIRHQREEDYH